MTRRLSSYASNHTIRQTDRRAYVLMPQHHESVRKRKGIAMEGGKAAKYSAYTD